MDPNQNTPENLSENSQEDNPETSQVSIRNKIVIQPLTPAQSFNPPAETVPEPPVQPAVATPNQVNPTEPSHTPYSSTPTYQNPINNPTGIITGDGGIIAGQTNPTPTPEAPMQSTNKFKTTKTKAIILGAVGLVLVSTLGFVFGYVLPNRPSNAYSTALDRSGKAITALTEKLTEKETIEKFQKTELAGKLDIDSEFLKASGSLSSKFDSTKFDGSADLAYTLDKDPEQKFSIKFLSEAKDKGQLPDSYLQIAGLGALEMGELSNAMKTIDGKWIGISSEYLKSLNPAGSTVQTDNLNTTFTYEDGVEITNALVGPTNEYVFNSDTNKSVLVQKEFVAIEQTDGITAYHYKMGLSKENSKKYCEALINSFYSTKVYKKFAGEEAVKNIDKDKGSAIESCKKDADSNIKEDETFDMWVDKKYKLIYKFRFTPDKKKPGEYVDVGQRYKGGDNLNFFINYSLEKEGSASFSVEANTKTAVSKATFEAKGTGEVKFSAKASFESKPLTSDLKIEKPANAVPVQDMLKQLGIEPDLLSSLFLLGGSGAGGAALGQAQAADSERKSDINAIHGQLEAYYAQNGVYPTLSQISDPAFRNHNLRGLDIEALKAPGSQDILSSTATKDRYGYRSPCPSGRVSECNTYELTAILSNGQTYTKRSLN